MSLTANYCGPRNGPLSFKVLFTDVRFTLHEMLHSGGKSVQEVREAIRGFYTKAMKAYSRSEGLPYPSLVWLPYKNADGFADFNLSCLESDDFIRKVGKKYELGERGKKFL